VVIEKVLKSYKDWQKWSDENRKIISGIVAIYGEMGVGKTSAVKQWLKSLNSKDLGSSPTFSIVNEYLSPTGVIYHFDFYRLNSLNEAEDIGLDDYFLSGRPCWIEWPENIGNLLPYNFGVVGIILSSGLVNLIVCIFLSIRLKSYEVNLSRAHLLKNIALVFVSCSITSTICYPFIKNINGLNSNIWDLFLLILGFMTFSIIYFSITKFLGVNKLNPSFKK